ncbi:hypothetical protein ASPWEDRAFT_166484 [Aspergillus wentii DTO 134E9]|uniref:Uncharacterized protein n=1 Tax=Aspergillus wentii DTO 134E9 TaxID=1073089 RepID=A0A1L9RZU3_ASPWE|nr:uncharacterized protein ASPWEDRAFT_166484 [Aspergillus wentii DTO 134E9]OJJ40414.1 hypothetical protein ASPWEDRAFT_166484 [Aspergillus wentii DTO 134E9]
MATIHPSKGPESFDLGVARSRSTSMSSDSQLPRSNLFAPPPVNPPPAFIASSAASQIITADQEFNTADFVAEDESGTGASALVTPAALGLLNGFLDHLLFNILAASKSTQLTSIRPAVAEVLKPRLAKEVVSAADDELSEYMGGAEDEQYDFRGGREPAGEFDLLRSWKLTRLRCMVYTRLGDMEEDDEDEYIAQDGLVDREGAPRRFTSHEGNITPAAAIFLTSIIEHLGEQGLVIAGETARSRLATRLGVEHDEVTESGAERGSMNRLVVEDHDMEKLALNATLGRLWRTWRKRLRALTLSRTVSRESFMRRNITNPTLAGSRKSSIVTIDEMQPHSIESQATGPKELDPASIPLPMSEHDVKEIEIPGFHADIDGEIQTMQAVVAHKVRPRSLMVLCSPSTSSPRSPSSMTSSPVTPIQIGKTRHARSRSLPNASSDAPSAPEGENTLAQASPTPSEERRRLETMYEHEEPVEPTEFKMAVASKSQQGEVTTEEGVSSVAEQKRSRDLEAPITSPQTDASSLEVATSQISSAQTSAEGMSDRQQEDSEEIFEGRGMCEKAPKPVSIQRPKRKSSRDPSRREDRSISSSVASEPAVQTVAEDRPPTQGGGDSPPVQHAVSDNNAPKEPSESVASSTTSPAPQTFLANDDDDDDDDNDSVAVASKPVQDLAGISEPGRPASGESGRSERSRTRPKPSPLSLTTSSLHGQGRSSPTVTTPGTERAAVQRLSSRPSTSMASSTYSRSRRSDSFSSAREKRPVTAGSTTSQVSHKLKGLISRPQGDSGSTRVRSSSETSRASADSGESAYADRSGLDKLIRSDETIHFTLTPRSMREMEIPDSPRWRANRSDTADLADLLKNTPLPGDESRPRTSNASSRGTLDFPPVSKSKSSDLPKHKPTIQEPRSSLGQKPRLGAARDARATNGSTRDFADFLKSTGPDTPRSVPDGAQSPRSRRLSDATIISKKFSRPASALSKDAASTRSSPKLQARPAAAAKSEQTSDLIDFIREGPPMSGAHRIPRTVAPFRNTMDSDDLRPFDSAQLQQDPPTRDSVASTQDESVANKSLASFGSRTGLLDSVARTNAQAAPIKQAPPPSSSANEFDDPFPVRKQRRVPDPYAIDSDDDDDELEELLEPSKPKREEESLIDFLRNAPPPESDTPPQPLAIDVSSYKSSSLANASSMKARFLRTTGGSSKSSTRQDSGNFSAGQSNYAAKVGQERGAGAAVHVTHGTPPAQSQRQTDTSALADFLRNTGPPEPPARAASSLAGSKKESTNTLSRLFARRKKVEA